ncbi:MAG: hypothetical protein AAGF87_15380 [Bacteroidota bacterium]
MKLLWPLLILLTSCAKEDAWVDYLPEDIDRLSYHQGPTFPMLFDNTSNFSFQDDMSALQFSTRLAEGDTVSRPLSITSIFPEIDSFPTLLDSAQIIIYEGYEFRYMGNDYLPSGTYMASRSSNNYYAAIIGNALWVAPIEALERIIDGPKYASALQTPRAIRFSDYIWRERFVPGLKDEPDPYFQITTADSSLRSVLAKRVGRENELREILAIIPRDVQSLLIAPDAKGQTFAQFYLAGEWMLLSKNDQLSIVSESISTEEYQSFNLEKYAEDFLTVDLGNDWTLKAAHSTDVKNYLDRFMIGSSLLNRPDVYTHLADHPDARYLRSWAFRNHFRRPINSQDPPDWWIGKVEGQLVDWTYFGEVSELSADMERSEFTFDSRVERWLDPASWPGFGFQLQNGQLVSAISDSGADSGLAWQQGPVDSLRALATPLQLLSEGAWPTEQGWQKASGERLDAPLHTPPTYLYLPAYDEALVLLATQAGRLLAIRPDGSFWQTVQGRSPNREGVPLVQSPVHIPGDDFDRILTLDEAGQLIFSDLEGKIIAQHDSLFEAEILPLTTDTFLAVRQVGHILLFDKKAGAKLDHPTPAVGEGELVILADSSGMASDLLTATGRSLRRITGDGLTRFLVQLPFEPSQLIAIDHKRWLAYHQGTRRWVLYRDEQQLLSNQRSDLPPQLIFGKLLAVEGNQIVVYDLE